MTTGRHAYRELGWGLCGEVVATGSGLRYCESPQDDAIHGDGTHDEAKAAVEAWWGGGLGDMRCCGRSPDETHAEDCPEAGCDHGYEPGACPDGCPVRVPGLSDEEAYPYAAGTTRD